MCVGEEGGKKRVNRRIFQLKEGEEVQPHNEDCSEILAYFPWSASLSDLNDLF